MKYGCQSETGKIKSIILKHPKDASYNQEYINANWKDLNYNGCPDYEKTIEEFASFVELIAKEAADIYYLPKDSGTGLDSVYTRDPALITEKGAVLGNMGKKQRQREPLSMEQYFIELGIPVLGSITGEGRLEGGDVVWLDDRVLAVGIAYRSNEEGVRQLRELTAGIVEEIVHVPLPHWNGQDDCLHLMSMLSPVDQDLAVVYSRLMPVPFRDFLISRGIRFIEVPDSEYDSMGCNVLSIAPGRCVVIAGNPLTKKMLEDEGVEVFEFKGENLCLKGGGGPTCLTRPILRT